MWVARLPFIEAGITWQAPRRGWVNLFTPQELHKMVHIISAACLSKQHLNCPPSTHSINFFFDPSVPSPH